jgi:Tol biopolymer transport system component
VFGWTVNGNDLICYRDWHFLLVGSNGAVSRQADETGGDNAFARSERVAYLSKSDTFIWVEHQRSPRSLLLTQSGPLAENSAMTGTMVIPSPDERFIAVAGNGMDLWAYDTITKTWANLGKADIQPNSDWDYIKPSWNPWFADSSRLVFFSGSSLVIASPDGRHRSVVYESSLSAGLAVPSPDGKQVAFVTFTPRPMKVRADLKFWGGTTVWTIPVGGKGKPQQVTTPNEDTTYDLNWMGNDRLVFGRIADQIFYSHARLWMVSLPR